MESAAAALRAGGVFCAYVPTIPQSQRVHEALAAHPAFALAETFETLLRPWNIAGPSVRPAHRMVAHTGFLTLARRVQPEAGGARPGAGRGAATPTRRSERRTARTDDPRGGVMLEGYFRLREHGTTVGTEVLAGLTTFMVMAYIIFVNPAILSFAGVPALQPQGVPFGPTLAATCLVAALATAAMGLVTNYPLAVASGMGLNAVVAFQLIAAQKLPWPAAMGVIFWEGVAHHAPRADRRARSGAERHPARPQAGHLGRDRPLHPLHRPGERRDRPARPGHPGDARAP